jgi:predicted glycoside hydrolase/deacetylase ChbG (UPF0249 family)/aminoglycoside phosphotransferase (APT) family kinase protein
VTDLVLASSLEDLVARGLVARGAPALESIRRQRSDYSTSAPIDEVTVELAGGRRLELMAKRLGGATLLDDARQAKPDFACSATREPALYALLADEPGLPRCWGLVHDGDGPLLVLERVPGLALRHIGDLSLWQAAAAWLAGFHGRWPASAGGVPAAIGAQLLRYDRTHHEHLLRRAVEVAATAGRPLAAAVVEQHARAVEILEPLPTTLVHGEFYASNVIVDQAVAPPRVAPIDWETAGEGPPVLDLAALVSGDWTAEDRRAIVDAYRRASAVDLPAADLDRALVAADLLISIQWAGWATGWRPPEDLAEDWAANAEARAADLAEEASRRSGRSGPAREQRGLIVNADDLGLSDGVNRGIFAAHDHGIVTSASLMVRGSAAAAAATGAALRPGLALGLHVDLGEWRFCDGAWEPVYEVVDDQDAEAVERDVDLQLGMFRSLVGRDPTHLDSHQHVHRGPVVGAVLSRIASALAVPLRGLGPISYCGGFYGQHSTGEPHPAAISVDNLVQIISALPAGVTELACHPGYDDVAASGYAEERFVELQALCDPQVGRAVSGAGIRLLSFADVVSG